MEDRVENPPDISELFECKPAREWVKMSKKIPRDPLFGEFWTQGEIAVVFGRTGAGKSIFAVQMAEFLGLAYPIEPFLNFTIAHKVLLPRPGTDRRAVYSPI